MNLTHHQKATRHMATEVEHINRLIYTKDLSVAKAKLMLADAATALGVSVGAVRTWIALAGIPWSNLNRRGPYAKRTK
jgi:hypothetical protein